MSPKFQISDFRATPPGPQNRLLKFSCSVYGHFWGLRGSKVPDFGSYEIEITFGDLRNYFDSDGFPNEGQNGSKIPITGLIWPKIAQNCPFSVISLLIRLVTGSYGFGTLGDFGGYFADGFAH